MWGMKFSFGEGGLSSKMVSLEGGWGGRESGRERWGDSLVFW